MATGRVKKNNLGAAAAAAHKMKGCEPYRKQVLHALWRDCRFHGHQRGQSAIVAQDPVGIVHIKDNG